MKPIAILIKKDLLLELRHQHTFFGILLYVASSIFVLFLAIGHPASDVYNGVFWMMQLFISINAVAKSFLQESKGRMIYFYLVSSPVQFVIAKMIYNAVVVIIMVVLSLILFLILLGSPMLDLWRFAVISFYGAFSISLVFTLMSAIAAKAQQNAAIMAILGFPLIIPQLMLLIRISKSAFGLGFESGALTQMVLLLSGLNILVILLAVILFPFLWKD